MNTIREIEKINQEELDRGIAGTSASWHAQYEKAPWVYIGNLDHELTEGDVLSVMSQFGEIEDIHLVREEDTGKSRGFAFLKYEDARSCVLAVDNFIGVKLCGRSMRVDHVEKYRLPNKLLEQEEAKEAKLLGPGAAYQDKELANEYNIHQGQDLFAPRPPEEKRDSKKGHETAEEKKKKKEERDRNRKEKDERRRHREEKRLEREERKRKKRARRMRHEDEDSEGRKHKRRKHERHEKKSKRGDSRSPSRSSKSK